MNANLKTKTWVIAVLSLIVGITATLCVTWVGAVSGAFYIFSSSEIYLLAIFIAFIILLLVGLYIWISYRQQSNVLYSSGIFIIMLGLGVGVGGIIIFLAPFIYALSILF